MATSQDSRDEATATPTSGQATPGAQLTAEADADADKDVKREPPSDASRRFAVLGDAVNTSTTSDTVMQEVVEAPAASATERNSRDEPVPEVADSETLETPSKEASIDVGVEVTAKETVSAECDRVASEGASIANDGVAKVGENLAEVSRIIADMGKIGTETSRNVAEISEKMIEVGKNVTDASENVAEVGKNDAETSDVSKVGEVVSKIIKGVAIECEGASMTNENVTTPNKDVTKTDEDVTKFDEDVTKLDKNVTKFDEDVTKLDEDVTKFDEDVTKFDEDVTQLDEEVRKFDKDVTKFDEDFTKLDDAATKSFKDVTKFHDDVTSVNKCVRKEGEDVPEVKDVSLQKSQDGPEVKEVSPQKSENFPELKDVSPRKSEDVPEVKDVSPQNSENVPEVKDVSPQKSENFPEVKDVSSQKSEYVPEVKDVSPRKSENVPEVKDVSPQKSKDVAEVKDVSPQNSEDILEVKDVSPQKSENVPEVKDVSPQKSENVPGMNEGNLEVSGDVSEMSVDVSKMSENFSKVIENASQENKELIKDVVDDSNVNIDVPKVREDCPEEHKGLLEVNRDDSDVSKDASKVFESVPEVREDLFQATEEDCKVSKDAPKASEVAATKVEVVAIKVEKESAMVKTQIMEGAPSKTRTKRRLPWNDMPLADEGPDPEAEFYLGLADTIRQNLDLHLDGKLDATPADANDATKLEVAIGAGEQATAVATPRTDAGAAEEPREPSPTTSRFGVAKKFTAKRRGERSRRPAIRGLSFLDITTQLIVRRKITAKADRCLAPPSAPLAPRPAASLTVLSAVDAMGSMGLARVPNPGLPPPETTRVRPPLPLPTVPAGRPPPPANLSPRKLSLRQRSTESEDGGKETRVVDVMLLPSGERSAFIEDQGTDMEPDPETAVVPAETGVSVESSNTAARHDAEPRGSAFSGDWVRPRTYVCAACNAPFADIYDLQEHKWGMHPNAWVCHYEFYDAHLSRTPADTARMSLELYKRFLQPQGVLAAATALRDVGMRCTKCQRTFAVLPEFHRHILDCGGDTTWMSTMVAASPGGVGARIRSRKWRPFGARRRRGNGGGRGRRGMKRNIRGTPGKSPGMRQRSRATDAESIQRMIANLPAKRSTRRAINFQEDIKTRSQATISSVTFVSSFQRPSDKSETPAPRRLSAATQLVNAALKFPRRRALAPVPATETQQKPAKLRAKVIAKDNTVVQTAPPSVKPAAKPAAAAKSAVKSAAKSAAAAKSVSAKALLKSAKKATLRVKPGATSKTISTATKMGLSAAKTVSTTAKAVLPAAKTVKAVAPVKAVGTAKKTLLVRKVAVVVKRVPALAKPAAPPAKVLVVKAVKVAPGGKSASLLAKAKRASPAVPAAAPVVPKSAIMGDILRAMRRAMLESEPSVVTGRKQRKMAAIAPEPTAAAPGDEPAIVCSHCAGSYTNRTAYMRHRKACPGSSPSKAPAEVPVPPARVPCDGCGVLLANIKSRDRHLKRCPVLGPALAAIKQAVPAAAKNLAVKRILSAAKANRAANAVNATAKACVPTSKAAKGLVVAVAPSKPVRGLSLATKTAKTVVQTHKTVKSTAVKFFKPVDTLKPVKVLAVAAASGKLSADGECPSCGKRFVYRARLTAHRAICRPAVAVKRRKAAGPRDDDVPLARLFCVKARCSPRLDGRDMPRLEPIGGRRPDLAPPAAECPVLSPFSDVADDEESPATVRRRKAESGKTSPKADAVQDGSKPRVPKAKSQEASEKLSPPLTDRVDRAKSTLLAAVTKDEVKTCAAKPKTQSPASFPVVTEHAAIAVNAVKSVPVTKAKGPKAKTDKDTTPLPATPPDVSKSVSNAKAQHSKPKLAMKRVESYASKRRSARVARTQTASPGDSASSRDSGVYVDQESDATDGVRALRTVGAAKDNGVEPSIPERIQTTEVDADKCNIVDLVPLREGTASDVQLGSDSKRDPVLVKDVENPQDATEMVAGGDRGLNEGSDDVIIIAEVTRTEKCVGVGTKDGPRVEVGEYEAIEVDQNEMGSKLTTTKCLESDQRKGEENEVIAARTVAGKKSKGDLADQGNKVGAEGIEIVDIEDVEVVAVDSEPEVLCVADITVTARDDITAKPEERRRSGSATFGATPSVPVKRRVSWEGEAIGKRLRLALEYGIRQIDDDVLSVVRPPAATSHRVENLAQAVECDDFGPGVSPNGATTAQLSQCNHAIAQVVPLPRTVPLSYETVPVIPSIAVPQKNEVESLAAPSLVASLALLPKENTRAASSKSNETPLTMKAVQARPAVEATEDIAASKTTETLSTKSETKAPAARKEVTTFPTTDVDRVKKKSKPSIVEATNSSLTTVRKTWMHEPARKKLSLNALKVLTHEPAGTMSAKSTRYFARKRPASGINEPAKKKLAAESVPIESTPMESAPKEMTAIDSVPKESAAPKESAPNKSASRDSIPKESGHKNTTPKESVLKKLAPKESLTKQSDTKESAANESAPNESAPKTSAAKESASKTSAANESAPKTSAAKESGHKMSAAKESAARESAVKDSAVEESAPKESACKESITKQLSQKESALKDSMPKESTPKHKTAKEPSPKESVHKDLTPKKSGAKDLTLMESAPKNSTPKESALKESASRMPSLVPTNPWPGAKEIPSGDSALATMIPVTTTYVAVTLETAPVTTASVPVTSETTSVTTTSLAVTPETAPVTTASMPVMQETTPVTTASVPVTPETMPVTTSSVAVTSETTPVTTASVAVTSEAAHVTAAFVAVMPDTTSVTTASMAVTSETTPVTTASVAVTLETKFVTTSSVSVTTLSVPVTVASSAVTPETLPVTTASLPVTLSSVAVKPVTPPVTTVSVPVTTSSVPGPSVTATPKAKARRGKTYREAPPPKKPPTPGRPREARRTRCALSYEEMVDVSSEDSPDEDAAVAPWSRPPPKSKPSAAKGVGEALDKGLESPPKGAVPASRHSSVKSKLLPARRVGPFAWDGDSSFEGLDPSHKVASKPSLEKDDTSPVRYDFSPAKNNFSPVKNNTLQIKDAAPVPMDGDSSVKYVETIAPEVDPVFSTSLLEQLSADPAATKEAPATPRTKAPSVHNKPDGANPPAKRRHVATTAGRRFAQGDAAGQCLTSHLSCVTCSKHYYSKSTFATHLRSVTHVLRAQLAAQSDETRKVRVGEESWASPEREALREAPCVAAEVHFGRSPLDARMECIDVDGGPPRDHLFEEAELVAARAEGRRREEERRVAALDSVTQWLAQQDPLPTAAARGKAASVRGVDGAPPTKRRRIKITARRSSLPLMASSSSCSWADSSSPAPLVTPPLGVEPETAGVPGDRLHPMACESSPSQRANLGEWSSENLSAGKEPCYSVCSSGSKPRGRRVKATPRRRPSKEASRAKSRILQSVYLKQATLQTTETALHPAPRDQTPTKPTATVALKPEPCKPATDLVEVVKPCADKKEPFQAASERPVTDRAALANAVKVLDNLELGPSSVVPDDADRLAVFDFDDDESRESAVNFRFAGKPKPNLSVDPFDALLAAKPVAQVRPMNRDPPEGDRPRARVGRPPKPPPRDDEDEDEPTPCKNAISQAVVDVSNILALEPSRRRAPVCYTELWDDLDSDTSLDSAPSDSLATPESPSRDAPPSGAVAKEPESSVGSWADEDFRPSKPMFRDLWEESETEDGDEAANKSSVLCCVFGKARRPEPAT